MYLPLKWWQPFQKNHFQVFCKYYIFYNNIFSQSLAFHGIPEQSRSIVLWRKLEELNIHVLDVSLVILPTPFDLPIYRPLKKTLLYLYLIGSVTLCKRNTKHSEPNIINKHSYNCICNMNGKSMGYGNVSKMWFRKAESNVQREQNKQMNPKYKYQLTIMFFSILSICQAQSTVDDIETYLFSEIFNSTKAINEFIELNDKNDTIRYWIFEKNGKLTREIDYRNNSWSALVSGQITHESTTFKTEIIYNYNQDGQIENYIETKNVDGNILKTIHQFKYPSSDTLLETFKIDDDKIKIDLEITKINENSNLKKIIQVMKNYMGTSYVQTIQRIEFSYNQENSLTSQNQYFSVNGFYENEEPETINEALGANTSYMYDEKGRLKNIHEVEYTEEGLPKLRKDVNFKYQGKTQRIKNIKINYGENYNPNVVE